jgi:hypothetical protein
MALCCRLCPACPNNDSNPAKDRGTFVSGKPGKGTIPPQSGGIPLRGQHKAVTSQPRYVNLRSTCFLCGFVVAFDFVEADRSPRVCYRICEIANPKTSKRRAAMKNLAFDFSGGTGNTLVLDVETQYLSDEVTGGWNAVDQFLVALVVTWDEAGGMRVWYEPDVPRLLAEAEKFRKVVTFNGENFDFKVLSHYGSVTPLRERSVDMLVVLSRKLGFRVKLDSLAKATLGKGKTGVGTESVQWWRSGDPAQRQKVVDYCKKDVELTKDIYLFGREKGYVLIEDNKQGGPRRVDVSW